MWSLGIFRKGKEELTKKGIRNTLLLMYCKARTQDYHILTFGTERGIIRVNVYYYDGHLKVTETKNLDGALVIDRHYQQRF